MFAGTVMKRTVRLLDHEYQTMLPDIADVPHGTFEFKYCGTGQRFHDDAGAAQEPGLYPYR